MISLRAFRFIFLGSILVICNNWMYAFDIFSTFFSKFQNIKLPMITNEEVSKQKKIISFIQQSASILAVQGLTYKALDIFHKKSNQNSLDFFYFYMCILVSSQFARFICNSVASLHGTEEYMHAQTISTAAMMMIIGYDLLEALQVNESKNWYFLYKF